MVCPITQGDHKQDDNIMVCPITQGDHNQAQAHYTQAPWTNEFSHNNPLLLIERFVQFVKRNMCRCQSTGLSCDLLLKLLHILLPCTYGHPAVTSVQASVLFMVALCNRADHIYLWPPYVIGGIIFLPCSFLMAALCNRGAIIFLPCDFYLSIIYLSFFFFLA